MAGDELATLLVQLAQRPNDLETRRRAAEILDLQGRSPDALALLEPFVNFTGHEEAGPLPCLCKTCITAAPLQAETAGVTFSRSFVVSGSRVLHFWLVDELAEKRTEVRRSVGEALKTRLKRKRRRKSE